MSNPSSARGAPAPSIRNEKQTWATALAADELAAFLRFAEIDSRPAAVIVRAAGPGLGQRECPAMVDAAQRAMADMPRGMKYAVLDLQHINTFSAMGVGLCTDFAKRARECKLEPVLFGLRGDLMDQLRMFKIDRIFKIVRSQSDLQALTG